MTIRLPRAWQALTTSEAVEAAEGDPVLVLPLAAIEQHGPHLPLSTDLDIGVGILREALTMLPDEIPVWTLPPQAVGTSEEHIGAAGTVSLGADELVRIVTDIGRSLAESGIRRLVLANSHGGNRHAMSAAGLRLRARHGMLVVDASYFRFARPDVDLPESEWRHGLHGGAIETAMMMHLHPEAVRANHVADFRSLGAELERSLRRLGPEGQASFAWLASDLNAAGAVGDATLATSDLGRRLVQQYGRALADVILDTRDFPLHRFA